MSKEKNIKVIFKISGCKMKHSKFGCKKSLVILTKLGAKFVLRIYQFGYMLLQPSSHADGKHKERLSKDRLPKCTEPSFFFLYFFYLTASFYNHRHFFPNSYLIYQFIIINNGTNKKSVGKLVNR